MNEPSLESIAKEAAADMGFSWGQFCGKGAFKETYRVARADGTVVAFKIIDRDKIDDSRTDREIDARRVEPAVARWLPHRPGRADFPHPVLPVEGSLLFGL